MARDAIFMGSLLLELERCGRLGRCERFADEILLDLAHGVPRSARANTMRLGSL
jgi:hypothetical protein